MNYKESRALPGGMLNSKEKTEYEDWIESKNKAVDKAKESDNFKSYGVLDKDCGSNGYHDDEGNEIKLSDYSKIFSDIYNGKETKHIIANESKKVIDSNKLKEALDSTDKSNDISSIMIEIKDAYEKLELTCKKYKISIADELNVIPLYDTHYNDFINISQLCSSTRTFINVLTAGANDTIAWGIAFNIGKPDIGNIYKELLKQTSKDDYLSYDGSNIYGNIMASKEKDEIKSALDNAKYLDNYISMLDKAVDIVYSDGHNTDESSSSIQSLMIANATLNEVCRDKDIEILDDFNIYPLNNPELDNFVSIPKLCSNKSDFVNFLTGPNNCISWGFNIDKSEDYMSRLGDFISDYYKDYGVTDYGEGCLAGCIDVNKDDNPNTLAEKLAKCMKALASGIKQIK